MNAEIHPMQRKKVEVVEVGPRDGLQILDRVVPTSDKIAWLTEEYGSLPSISWVEGC
jgi:hypothetical protein